MTERKPPNVSWSSWVDRQIEDGRRSGAFDDLPGTGRPIDDLDRPHDDLWWVKSKLQREDVVVTPPTIAIRADRDAVLDEAMSASSESEVRDLIEGLNERIRDVNRWATWGPPSTLAPLDIDGVIERWRATRPPDWPAATAVEVPVVIATRRRRFLEWLRVRRSPSQQPQPDGPGRQLPCGDGVDG